jgi:hypothetical protein
MHKQQIPDGIYVYWKQNPPKPLEKLLDTVSGSPTAVLDSSIQLEVEDAEFTVHFVRNTALIEDGTVTEMCDLSQGKRTFKSEFCSDPILDESVTRS